MAINFRKTEFTGVAATLDQCPASGLPEVILSGRSNVGKSSLVNSLAGNRQLARTSNKPGKTRLIIYFKVDGKLWLTDLPGYGYAAASRQDREKFSDLADHYLSCGRPFALVLLLLDIRRSPSTEDCQMLDWLRQTDQPYRVILTKADKLGFVACRQRAAEIAADLAEPDPAELIVFSAQTGQGIDALRQVIGGQS